LLYHCLKVVYYESAVVGKKGRSEVDEVGMATYPMRGETTVEEFYEQSYLPELLPDHLRAILIGVPHRPRVVYLAGPYRPYVDDDGVRHGIAENVREAGKLGIQIWQRGYVALVPHTLTYLSPAQQRQDGGIADIPPEQFMDGELELIRRSDMVVLMPNWRISRGAVIEKDYAERVGIPVLTWDAFLGLREAA
jgi:hypothetical protein